MPLRCRFLVLIAFTAAAHVGVVAAGSCNGMGRRYCLNAHLVTERCPKSCQLQNCADNEDSRPRRGGGWEGVEKPTWEEIALSGKYEFVYTDSDWLCLASCWYRPEKSKCRRWEYGAGGGRYCTKLSCQHDERDRYAGCHSDSNGNRKLPWHRPTCKECLHVFPLACGSQLSKHVEAEDAAKAEAARVAAARAMEMAARGVCYDQHFRDLHAVASRADESSSTRRRGLRSSQRHSSEGSDSEDESSSESDSGSEADTADDSDVDTESESEKGEEATSSGFIMRQAVQKVKSGEWKCPPPQCLTTSLQLLQRYSAPSPPPPAPPSPPPAPWYHSSPGEGFCSWNSCQTGPQGNAWCRSTAFNCVERCGGTWCPPPDAPRSWRPVASNDFVSAIEATLETTAEPEIPMTWSPPTEFNTSMCGTPITDIGLQDAEGLSWEQTEEPFTSDIGSLMQLDDDLVMVDFLSAANPRNTERNADYIAYDDDYEDVFDGWDEILAPKANDRGTAVAYVVFQLAEPPNEINTAELLDAAMEMTRVEAGNIIVLDEPAITLSDEPFSTIILVVGAESPEEVVARMEAYKQEALSRVLSHAGVTYLLWSMTANVQDVSTSLVSDMKVFQVQGLPPSVIGATAASATALLIVVAFLVWRIVRRKTSTDERLPACTEAALKHVPVCSL